jgi:uncharacterized RDD family membrane protein YckC
MEMSSDQINPDQINIDTPELVEIELPLAGIGSRFLALLIDYLIWFAGIFLLSWLYSIFLPGLKNFSELSLTNGRLRSRFLSFFCSTGGISRFLRLSGMGALRASGWRAFM